MKRAHYRNHCTHYLMQELLHYAVILIVSIVASTHELFARKAHADQLALLHCSVVQCGIAATRPGVA